MKGDAEFSRIYFSNFKLFSSSLLKTYSFLMTFIAYFVDDVSKRDMFLEARSTLAKCPRPSMLNILKSAIFNFENPFAVLVYVDNFSLFLKSICLF